MRRLEWTIESFAIAGSFTISRGSKREAVVVTVRIGEGDATGRGECTPYARYGETPEGIAAHIASMADPIARGMTRGELQSAMPAGAARNAIDCALWDLEAKQTGVRAWQRAGMAAPEARLTCYTISLAEPEVMAARAIAAAHMPLLKLKLGGEGDALRMAAVRRARPDARLVADANEAWSPYDLERLLAAAATCAIELIEQPLPAGDDGMLAKVAHVVPICADESAHTADGLADLRDRYDAVNIKLDKTGGLTGALDMARHAHALGLKVMAGCMVATSLAMAPAVLVAQAAHWSDLDGPLLLARDREPPIGYDGALIRPPQPELWG